MNTYAIPGFAEPVNSLTHLLGAGVYAALSVFLLRRGRGNRARLFCLGVFAFSCVFLLSMSGVYHLLGRGGAGRAVMQRLDHAAIFVLIAATFTPAHGILFTGPARWGPMLLVWSAAITGLTLKTIFFSTVPGWVGMSCYMLLGWVGTLSGIVLWRRYGFSFVSSLLYGGMAYTLGALPLGFGQPILIPGVVGPHELFHIAVLCGIGFHWSFVYRFAAGNEPMKRQSGNP